MSYSAGKARNESLRYIFGEKLFQTLGSNARARVLRGSADLAASGSRIIKNASMKARRGQQGDSEKIKTNKGSSQTSESRCFY